MNSNLIRTFSGGHFDFNNPENSDIVIEDIAITLSRIPRFNGHSKFHYTVAQHCVLMHKGLLKECPETSPLTRLHILLHDASEAYMGDLCRPLKYHEDLKGFREMEVLVQSAIYRSLGFPEPTKEEHEIVKEYDDRMLRTEIGLLTSDHNPEDKLMQLEPLFVQINPWKEHHTRDVFLMAYASAKVDYETSRN